MGSEKQAMLAWAKEITQALDDKCDLETRQIIERAVEALNGDRFSLAVLGKAKRGKSTFINSILGRKDDVVAPVDRLPASSAISRFKWANSEKATVIFRNGNRQNIRFESIRDYVTEEINPENVKGVDVVEIEGPFQTLDREFEIVDTPGAGSLHEHHDAILHAFIPQADAVIFLVSARMPLDQDELELLQKVKAADIGKVFFAINRTDESTDDDINAAINHNRELLSQIGLSIQKIYRISAKRAFEGEMDKSGVASLMTDVTSFIRNNKGQVLKSRFASRIGGAVGPLLQAMEIEASSGSKSEAELDAEIATLNNAKSVISSERDLAIREFSLTWRRAVDEYEKGLHRVNSEVTATMVRRVQDTSLFEVSSLAKQLPTILTTTVEEKLQPIASCFENSARNACKKLQSDFPSLTVGEAGNVILTTREGSAAITGAVGGAAAAAAGTSLVVAGATVSASIAAANATALAAASTTVVAPSAVSGILTLVGLEMLAPLATGTATVSAPAILTTTPMWVALSGPIGWTIVGVGALAIPFSWRISKLKMRDQIEDACRAQLKELFEQLRGERLLEIREMGGKITEEAELQFDRRIHGIESALISARDKRIPESELKRLSLSAARIRNLLSEY